MGDLALSFLVTLLRLPSAKRISMSEFSILYLTATISHASGEDLVSTRKRSAAHLVAICLVVIVCGEVYAKSITVVGLMFVLLSVDAFIILITLSLCLLVIRHARS